MELVIVTNKGFVTENGNFTSEYPDAALTTSEKWAKFIADSVFHLQGIEAEVIANYGYEDQKVIYTATGD